MDGCYACRSQGKLGAGQAVFLENPAFPVPSWIPGCVEVCRPWLLCRLRTPRDALWFAPDLLAVWSHLSGVGRATFICCLLVPVGASLAALWGDSLRVSLFLLFHLLYNFPDLALCSLQWREGRGGHRGETIPVPRPRRKPRV